MELNIQLFEKLASEALKSSRLRKAFDLRDSEDEGCQRMLNVLQPGTKTKIHRHTDTSEVVVCIYGSAIERFYDEKGFETACFLIKAGSELPGIVVEKNQFHSLEATGEVGVVLGVKAGNYQPMEPKDILE